MHKISISDKDFVKLAVFSNIHSGIEDIVKSLIDSSDCEDELKDILINYFEYYIKEDWRTYGTS